MGGTRCFLGFPDTCGKEFLFYAVELNSERIPRYLRRGASIVETFFCLDRFLDIVAIKSIDRLLHHHFPATRNA